MFFKTKNSSSGGRPKTVFGSSFLGAGFLRGEFVRFINIKGWVHTLTSSEQEQRKGWHDHDQGDYSHDQRLYPFGRDVDGCKAEDVHSSAVDLAYFELPASDPFPNIWVSWMHAESEANECDIECPAPDWSESLVTDHALDVSRRHNHGDKKSYEPVQRPHDHARKHDP